MMIHIAARLTLTYIRQELGRGGRLCVIIVKNGLYDRLYVRIIVHPLSVCPPVVVVVCHVTNAEGDNWTMTQLLLAIVW